MFKLFLSYVRNLVGLVIYDIAFIVHIDQPSPVCLKNNRKKLILVFKLYDFNLLILIITSLSLLRF